MIWNAWKSRKQFRHDEDALPDTPEAFQPKWRGMWIQLWDRKVRLGLTFPELAEVQLRLAGEVVRDLERLYGPLNPRISPAVSRSL